MASDTAQKVIKCHPDYDDPTDDLVFVSNDGIYFRVSSHKLAKVRLVRGHSITWTWTCHNLP